jgi:hypothetical protein
MPDSIHILTVNFREVESIYSGFPVQAFPLMPKREIAALVSTAAPAPFHPSAWSDRNSTL